MMMMMMMMIVQMTSSLAQSTANLQYSDHSDAPHLTTIYRYTKYYSW